MEGDDRKVWEHRSPELSRSSASMGTWMAMIEHTEALLRTCSPLFAVFQNQTAQTSASKSASPENLHNAILAKSTHE